MSIADAQARKWIEDILKDAANNVATAREIPFERTPETASMLQTGAAFTDDETGQEFYPVVFVLVSESEAEQGRVARALIEAFRLR